MTISRITLLSGKLLKTTNTIFSAIYGENIITSIATGGYEAIDASDATSYFSYLSLAMFIPSLYIATKIVHYRPFSSYSSSRGGWDWKLYFKCLIIPILVYAVVTAIAVALGVEKSNGSAHVSAIAMVLCLILIPLQCIGEEYLFRGMGYSTVYGVKKGTYMIGVRSSSELYKITATFTEVVPSKYGKTKSEAAVIERNTPARGVVLAKTSTARWYKITLPESTRKGQKRAITIKASNNNKNLNSGIKAIMLIKKPKKGFIKRTAVVNNDSFVKKLSVFKNRTRDVYVKVYPKNGTTGTYTITWK